MSYQWVSNILCVIDNGQAALNREYREKSSCDGRCYSCKAFLGVDLTDTGKDYYQSCCNVIGDMRKAA
jgi:hypothetical protein